MKKMKTVLSVTLAGLLAEGTEEAKETAKKFRPHKFYICKVIDREHEAHGIKFWRFRDNYQKQGTFDKIVNVMKSYNEDMTDPTVESGRDLVIDIARNANQIPLVQTILPAPHKSVLSADADLAKEWLNDPRTWRDVYAVKDYEYLDIIIQGGTPTFDKVNEKWVDKDSVDTVVPSTKASTKSLDNELELGNTNSGLVAKTPVAETVKTVVKTEAIAEVPTTVTQPVTTTVDEEEDEDMPF